jgi:rsbT co-antagonist protein RsbR
MATAKKQGISQLLLTHEQEVLTEWMARLKAEGALQGGRIKEGELQRHCSDFLRSMQTALESGQTDGQSATFGTVRDQLAALSRSRAELGFSPRETALFVFSLKPLLIDAVERHSGADAAENLEVVKALGVLLDSLGLFTMEAFQKTREELIVRQQQEISELSTPVIKLWNGVLALPLIGTLDSQRTQVVMENLLESIVAQGAEMAIIDITGVPTVDTLTAQHLLKTIAAARLMGADCIISGIRPQIAQTMVHLGVELTVVSKATLADAFALALSRQGKAVMKVAKPADSRSAL